MQRSKSSNLPYFKGGQGIEITIEAFFDGKVFRPKCRIDLAPNRSYVLIVAEKKEKLSSQDAWSILGRMTGTIDLPKDWAQERDHYLYGVPKRKKKTS